MGFTSQMLELLQQPLDPARVGKRKGSGSMMLSYLEGYDVIDTLNRIFGYDGWSYEMIHKPELIVEVDNGVVYQAGVKLILHTLEPTPGGLVIVPGADIVRSDIGVGLAISHSNVSAETHEKAIKESVTDALKRAARTLGEQFGNSLYDKASPLHDLATGPGTGKQAAPSKPVSSGEPIHCESCGKQIRDGKKWSAAQLADLSRKQNNGKVLCYTCSKKAQA